MAHVVSNAYVKSPTAKDHSGFSAGSYKDLTRVAWLNEDMWTELFLENKDALVNELDIFIKNVAEYRDAISNNDADTLRKLLADGKHCKEEIDGV
jgi:prephenate dehydrogenase